MEKIIIKEGMKVRAEIFYGTNGAKGRFNFRIIKNFDNKLVAITNETTTYETKIGKHHVKEVCPYVWKEYELSELSFPAIVEGQ